MGNVKTGAKALVLGLVAALVLTMSGVSQAWAEQIGVVDTDRIGREYKRAQELGNEIRTREKDLQGLRLDLAKELKDKSENMSPVEKKSLEDQLNKQFAEKFKEYRDWTLTQEKEIRGAVETAISQVKTDKSIDVVLTKAVVIEGGLDITTEVLTKLNQ